jgi:hypothetical protein
VVIHDLNVCWSSLGPSKANTPLIIDANTVLAGAVAFQFFQTIAGRGPQEFESFRCIELGHLSSGDFRDRAESLRASSFKEFLSLLANEALDHGRQSITLFVKRQALSDCRGQENLVPFCPLDLVDFWHEMRGESRRVLGKSSEISHLRLYSVSLTAVGVVLDYTDTVLKTIAGAGGVAGVK